MDFSLLAIALLAILAVAMETEGCMCEYQSLRQYYCNADFAVLATVSNWTRSNDSPTAESSYILNIRKSYKMPSSLRNETEVLVHSIADDGLCGINPGRPGIGKPRHTKRYFITGFVTETGTLWSRLCQSTYRSWKYLSKDERKEIRRMKNFTC